MPNARSDRSQGKTESPKVKIKCPYCSAENDICIGESHQVLNVHRDDRVLGTRDENERVYRCKECKKDFNVQCFEGNVVGKYKHPLENLLDVLTMHSNRIGFDKKSSKHMC